MNTRLQDQKLRLIEDIAEDVARRLSQDPQGPAADFVRAFYADVPPRDLAGWPRDQLQGAALSMLAFLKQRRPGVPTIRVANPSLSADGWQARHTVIEIVNDDMPFLVDSIAVELARLDIAIHLIIHPILPLTRDAAGTLLHFGGETRESVMHLAIDPQSDPERLSMIARRLETVLSDVRLAVADWERMRGTVHAVLADLVHIPAGVPADELGEARVFLEWAEDNHFTFLGIRHYRLQEGALAVVPGQGLGLLRDDTLPILDAAAGSPTLPPDVVSFIQQPGLLLVTKAGRRSTVHRPVAMDLIGVKQFSADGTVTGMILICGLFTSVAYSRSPRDIPYLRRKAARALDRAGYDRRSHNGKALTHILDSYPRDELFQINEDELYEIAIGILHLQERSRVAVFIRRDPFGRFFSALVYVPRDRYTTDLRRAIQAILEREAHGTVETYYTTLDDSVLARIHFLVTTGPDSPQALDAEAIEADVIEAARAWPDRFEEALIEAEGAERGLLLARRYAGAAPAGYRESTSPRAAVADINQLEHAQASGGLALSLSRPPEMPLHRLRLKLYQVAEPLVVSDVLPTLENLGLRVITESVHRLALVNPAEAMFIHDMLTESRSGQPIDLSAVKTRLSDAFLAVWDEQAEDDGFNRLVVGAGLSWREVTIIRAYARYLRQARFPFGQEAIAETLAGHPDIARLLVKLFTALHDPAEAQPGSTIARGVAVEIQHLLDDVANADDDLILRRFVNLIMSTLRTNHFQTRPDGSPKPWLSLKLDSGAIDDLPLPRPWREIFVYSPRMEGIHLRGGKVARGGIRWSDRREDFRTEILGLMKAQTVKNTVIVPVGAKGGFIVKHPPPASNRDAFAAEGIECYRTLVRGMLDITDNQKGSEIIPPENVVRRDGDDPYLVVAADKGTASFSDIANALSGEYGHWLGDAFASGGSSGYDHKKMGITARGAWESVKRHFRELGEPIEDGPFTVAGVGDMAGDVFGNGMLLSENIKLVAAFNHSHIFLDPDPDPAVSFAERERLFTLPRSQWSDYDPALISKGGAVFRRDAKTLTISAEAKELLGTERENMTPAELMSAILKAPVDLLYLGGIGTYVKATEESHADAGDKANDAARVNAAEIQAQVVAEGANLGLTQAARIEFARHGGRINTDFIDNSAGVDTSDHEVNIKILLNDVVAAGDMTLKQRDALLVQMTPDVAGLVLRDNYLQTQALTIAEGRAEKLLGQHVSLIRSLEKSGRLKRRIEGLPDEEALNVLAEKNLGLTRPELAVLLSYSKMALFEAVVDSDLPDATGMEAPLMAYFPQALQQTQADPIRRHRLRREIISTVIVNEVINRCGPTFVDQRCERSGRSAADVVRAWLVVRDALDLTPLWAEIEALDGTIPGGIQTDLHQETIRVLAAGCDWLLTQGADLADPSAATARYRPMVEALREALPRVLTDRDRGVLDERAYTLTGFGVPADLARHVTGLRVLSSAFDLAGIAARRGLSIETVAEVYFQASDAIGLADLRERARDIETRDRWTKAALMAEREGLDRLQARLAESILAEGGSLDDFRAKRPGAFARLDVFQHELARLGHPDLAALAVANRLYREVVT